jgi:methyl-accepting chemotaxis protein
VTDLTSHADAGARRAQTARTLAEEAGAATAEGTQRMESLTTVLAEMRTSADATSRIVEIIDEIAFQTNLFALNAAVEAAVPGTRAAVFAVVAEEARSLAGRSAAAAKQTADLIESSVTRAGESVAVSAEESSSTATELAAQAAQLAELVDSFSLDERTARRSNTTARESIF